MTSLIKDGFRSAVPLPARMRLAAWLARQPWLPVGDHFAVGLVRDLLVKDPKGFHKFLWSNHFMGYARWYDSEDELFAFEQMQPSRIEFFRDLTAALDGEGIDRSGVRSILEVGCSQGYLLRYAEVNVFPTCPEIMGIDIDAPAIAKGQEVLGRAGSRVTLMVGDMEALDTLVGDRLFDVSLVPGVLSYLDESDAVRMVARLLSRTGKMVAFAGLACLERNNNELTRSQPSPNHPGQWIHNFEALVTNAGWRVVRTRWEGPKEYNRQTICFVFAVPGSRAAR
jgi:SAM-dependent methyltransferase